MLTAPVDLIFHFGEVLNDHLFGDLVAGPPVDDLSPDLVFAIVLIVFPKEPVITLKDVVCERGFFVREDRTL